MIKETLAGYLLFAGQLPFSRSSAAAEVTPRKRRLLREADKSLSICPGLRQKRFRKLYRTCGCRNLRVFLTPQAAIRGKLAISSTSRDPHNNTCILKSWATLKNRFPVASVRRFTARLVAGQLDVSVRTWNVPIVWSTALEATEMQLHVVAVSEVDTK
jgi:hypothetical protein